MATRREATSAARGRARRSALRDHARLTAPLAPESAMGFDEYKSALKFEEWVGWGKGGEAM